MSERTLSERLTEVLLPTRKAFDTNEEWLNFLGDLSEVIIDFMGDAVGGQDSTMLKLQVGEVIAEGRR